MSDALFLLDVQSEVDRAREKFPSPVMSFPALVEEVGELAKAILSENTDRVYAEAVQVATMALRVAVEGDPATDNYRRSRGMDKLRAR